MFKKLTAILLTVCLIAGLAGCGGQTKETAAQTGRYVEKQINLPENVDASQVFQIARLGEKMHLYTLVEKAGQVGFESYQYDAGNYTAVTPAWLSGLSFEKEQIQQYTAKKVIENVGGKSYLYSVLVEDESWIGHLYCSADGQTVQEITPADWLVENEEYHFYEYPQDIAILDDGTIVACYSYKIRYYEADTYTMTKEVMLDGQHSEKIYGSKDKFYLIKQSDYLDFKGIESYGKGSDQPQETITMEVVMGNSNFLDILTDGSLVLSGKGGIIKQDAKTGQWDMVMDGIYASFGLESMWCVGMAALDNGSYYALFRDDSEQTLLMEYNYDAEAVQKPDTILTVYSVHDNSAVNQAAAMYTKQNPSVLVQVESAIRRGEEDTADMNAIAQSLNTKLIAGEGPDILVLDGLDIDSFVEKRMLADISEEVVPLAQDGTILKNVVDSYVNEDGTVYMVPLKLSVNLLIGDKIDAVKAGTLQGMAQEVSAQTQPVFGPMTAQDFADCFVPYIVSDIVNGKELNKEVLSEKLEYLKAIVENGGFIDAYLEDTYKWGIWDVPSAAGAAFYDGAGFLQCMFPMAVVKFVNASFTSFENSFRPIGQMGINTSCKNVDVAKDFLKFALSFEMQDGDFYDGFPMNVQALENQITKDRSGYGAFTQIETEDGQYVDFEINEITPENQKKLVELCKQVDKKAVSDAKITEVIAQALPDYVSSVTSLEETVNKIEKGLNMYLAE